MLDYELLSAPSTRMRHHASYLYRTTVLRAEVRRELTRLATGADWLVERWRHDAPPEAGSLLGEPCVLVELSEDDPASRHDRAAGYVGALAAENEDDVHLIVVAPRESPLAVAAMRLKHATRVEENSVNAGSLPGWVAYLTSPHCRSAYDWSRCANREDVIGSCREAMSADAEFDAVALAKRVEGYGACCVVGDKFDPATARRYFPLGKRAQYGEAQRLVGEMMLNGRSDELVMWAAREISTGTESRAVVSVLHSATRDVAAANKGLQPSPPENWSQAKRTRLAPYSGVIPFRLAVWQVLLSAAEPEIVGGSATGALWRAAREFRTLCEISTGVFG